MRSGSSRRASGTDKIAKILYEAKCKPFFKQIDEKLWYMFKGSGCKWLAPNYFMNAVRKSQMTPIKGK